MRLNQINDGDIVGLFEKSMLALRVDGKLIIASPKEIGVVTKFDQRLNIAVEPCTAKELLAMVNSYENNDSFSLLCKRMIVNTLEKEKAITEIFNCY